jgi:hypothetical protein
MVFIMIMRHLKIYLLLYKHGFKWGVKLELPLQNTVIFLFNLNDVDYKKYKVEK